MKRWWTTHWPAVLLVLLAIAALLPLAAPRGAATAMATVEAVEWPMQFEGRSLRPLAASEVERRFAARFPGAIGRFSDGERVIVLRRVTAPTRMLHPAADCFRGLGHRIAHERLERDADGRLWRSFESTAPDGERLRVRERIAPVDGRRDGGDGFVDASSWFWAALLGRSHGPWLAATVVEKA